MKIGKMGWSNEAELGANGTWESVEFKWLQPCPLQMKQWLRLLQRLPLDDTQPRSMVSPVHE